MWWLVLVVLALLLPEILSTILDSRLGRAVAARIEGAAREGETPVTDARARHLEAEVERLSEEVRRLREESDFLQRLLDERASTRPRPLPPGDEPR